MCNIIDPRLHSYRKELQREDVIKLMESGSPSSATAAAQGQDGDEHSSILQNGLGSAKSKLDGFSGTAETEKQPADIIESETVHLEGTLNEDGSQELRIPVPWGQISAKAFGSPKGQPVLGVHGWMDNAGTFDKLVPLLPKSLYFVAVDLPGHGRSSHLPQGIPYHYTDFVIALRRITNHLKWTKFSWIGHSMGAGLGALYAATFPSYVNKFTASLRHKQAGPSPDLSKLIPPPNPQVERLIMLDLAKPITGESGADYASKISLAIDQFLALEEKIQPIPPSYDYNSAVERLVKGTGDSLTHESAKILMIRGAKQVSEDKWAFTRDLRLRSPSILRFSHEQCFTILADIRSRTMVIKARNAPWFEPKEICEKALEIYKQNCASFQFVEVEGNHFVHLNEPERVAEAVNQFLSEQKAGL